MRTCVVLFTICIAFVSSTQFSDCGSSATNINLAFEGCELPPCIVERGQNYDLNIDFKAGGVSETVTNKISANIGGIQTPWPGLDKNGCNNLEAGGTPCPLVAENDYLWYMEVAILSDYPTLTTLATVSFVDDNKDFIVCIQVPVTIV